jgi:NAD(P)H-quinone oxidoreductase subunit 5
MSSHALFLVPLLHAALAMTPARLPLGRRWDLATRAAELSLLGAGVATGLGTSDLLTGLMLALVSGLAVFILRFSRRALDGEPGQERFLRAFHAVLAAVTLVAVTRHLLVLIGAWTLTGLALHPLLTFYPERSVGQLAARKKFLVSRLADVALLAAAALLWRSLGTLDIDALNEVDGSLAAQAAPQVAGVLVVLGVALRSAMLPFHGWLIQVMEAPTPVSALLHAGVVNVGGFVMIKLSGLMGQLYWAQTLLVGLGTVTAVAAGLVMMTRVSVKVALAWSTCAQLGFMLMECGLGAPRLAALHLAAHSLYKAHGFLSSGRAVEAQQRRDMAPPLRADLGRWLLSAAASLLLVWLAGRLAPHEENASVLRWLVALAAAPLLVRASTVGGVEPWVRALAFVALALAWHGLLGVTPQREPSHALEGARSAWVALWFSALYAIQAAMLASPRGWLAQRLYPWAFAGFYLDEPLTRLTRWLGRPMAWTRPMPDARAEAAS